MKLLLDTRAFIWWDSDSAQLSSSALAALPDPVGVRSPFVWLWSRSYNRAMIKSIDVSGLPEPLVEAIESLVSTYRQRARATDAHRVRPIGWFRGNWELPDSFFEPLPDDVLEGFAGDEQP